MRRVLFPLLAVAVVVVVVVGLSQASSKQSKGPTKSYGLDAALKELAGSPAPLAALHDQASQLLGGGKPAFDARLAALKGHPIVINKWASWCTPCRAEFPVLQRVSARLGKQVAFVGLDGSRDSVSEAKKFLRRFPVSYPSYRDPKEKIARSVQAPAAYPITIFVDRNGKVVIPHSGSYDSVAKLEADIKRYLHV